MFVLAPVALNGTLTGGLPAFHALGACVTFAQAYAATIMKSEKTELVFNITRIQGVYRSSFGAILTKLGPVVRVVATHHTCSRTSSAAANGVNS